jgi:hypothetical protein
MNRHASKIHFVHAYISQASWCKDLIHYFDYFLVVIALSMGSAKKKPMTKKEREEKRRKHKEKRLQK